jgi:hypothetical protein
MGFDKSKLADVVKVPATFPHLYRDENGEPVKFVFEMRIETEADADALQRSDALGVRSNHERNVERLSRLLTAPPSGFDDFPQNGKSLGENVKDFFTDSRCEHIVKGVFSLYNKAVLPDELFR